MKEKQTFKFPKQTRFCDYLLNHLGVKSYLSELTKRKKNTKKIKNKKKIQKN